MFGEPLLRAVEKDLMTEDVVDGAMRRVLKTKFLIGLFDNPFVDPEAAEKLCNCDEHAQLALRAAREAIVLLKNEGILPLSRESTKSIAVLGPASDKLSWAAIALFPVTLLRRSTESRAR
ncbi:MAG: hypothetical protein ACUVQY_06940 [Thermoproteota archaeon]